MGEVEAFLERNGLNSKALLESTRGVTSKAEEAIGIAAPAVKQTAGSLSTASPQTLGQYALGLVALYYLVRGRSFCPSFLPLQGKEGRRRSHFRVEGSWFRV